MCIVYDILNVLIDCRVKGLLGFVILIEKGKLYGIKFGGCGKMVIIFDF